VTSFCPTLISNSLNQLERNFAVLEQTRKNFPQFAASAPCYHLEGPYLSPGASRGAHDPRFMHAPDVREFERLQTASGGRIGILTLAPELPNALALIESASKAGIRIGLSHTDCTPDTIWAAVRAGATLSTHLGNGCPEMIHRHRTPIWAQLAADELYASIICDMFHLPGELVKVVFRMKGPDKCILVSDAIHLAGMPPGKYALLTTPVELLPDGKIIRSSGDGLAGSTLTMEKAVSNFMRLADISLDKALQAAVTNPANFLRSDQIARSLAPGNVANVILFTFDGSVHIESCLLAGEQVYP
jgi:N-acetylglucosamine-6-phosphate deacetylase